MLNNNNDGIKVLSNIDQIKTRSDMWIGTCKPELDYKWIYNIENNKIEIKEFTYYPQFVKLFEELLNNSVDNYIKYKNEKISKNYRIDLTINTEKNSIIIKNNGKPISNKFFDSNDEDLKKKYIAEIIFNTMYSSSNYDDSYNNTNSVNGLGAKLTNIFSKKMRIETRDTNSKLVLGYKNFELVKRELELIKNGKDTDSYTEISYIIDFDLAKINIDDFSIDNYNYIIRRCIDVSAYNSLILNIKIDNKEKFFDFNKNNSIKDYYKLYINVDNLEYSEIDDNLNNYIIQYEDKNIPIAFIKKFNKIEINNCLINSNSCIGNHEKFIKNKLTESLKIKLSKKINIEDNLIKTIIDKEIFIIGNISVEKPNYDNQAKTVCKNTSKEFPSIDLTKVCDKMIKNWDIKDYIENFSNKTNATNFMKSTNISKKNNIVRIDKFFDANRTTKTNNLSKHLFITEGDSAQRFVTNGIKTIKGGLDIYGSYSTFGKFINPEKKGDDRLFENKIFKNLVDIIGLDVTIDEYTEDLIKNKLRFQSVILTADADPDGIDICGLLLNMFNNKWPSLLKLGYVRRFITPIAVINNKSTKNKEMIFDENEYIYRFTNGEFSNNNINISYKKGLASLTNEETKEIFKDLDKYIKNMSYLYEENNESYKESENIFEIVFGKDPSLRKKWMSNTPDNKMFNPFKVNTIYMSNFFNYELIKFANYSIIRAIPSLYDGLKTVQRKILYWFIKNKNLVKFDKSNGPKVSVLNGKIMSDMYYHHGNMEETIIYMAQDFVGTNNYPFLYPINNFGSRDLKRSKTTAARYINTCLNKLTLNIFREEDLPLYSYVLEDGEIAEPYYMCPIIPTILLNGSNGLAMGYRVVIEPFATLNNLINITLQFVEKKIFSIDLSDLVPEINNFKGTIKYIKNNTYINIGNFKLDLKNKKLNISEIPVHVSVSEFNDNILSIQQKSNDIIKECERNHTENSISFDITLSNSYIAKLIELDDKDKISSQLIEDFKLSEIMNLTLSLLVDDDRDNRKSIKEFSSISEIFIMWAIKRYKIYELRKSYYYDILLSKYIYMLNKYNFIKMFIDNKEYLINSGEKIIIDTCIQNKIIDDKSIKNVKLYKVNYSLDILFNSSNRCYSSLLDLPIKKINTEGLNQTKEDIDKLSTEIENLLQISIWDLWKKELIELKNLI